MGILLRCCLTIAPSKLRLLFSVALLVGISLATTLAEAHSRSRVAPSKPRAHVASSSQGKKTHAKRRGAWKRHGQQGIDEQRAREIQAALIREKYLNGEPTGKWDQSTKDAMTRFQADHGWQTKVTPDSRALIVLGLGSKHENVLNPESLAAMPAIAVPNTAAPSGAAVSPQR
jgi:peptidoglycan hydrolase-like protein with peptidoglycan-binding domain